MRSSEVREFVGRGKRSPAPSPVRLLIFGLPGSGKTTLARAVARELEIPHIEADRHFWSDQGTQREAGEFIRLMQVELARLESFVVEGHFKSVKDLVLARATHVVYLDPPTPVVVKRLILRQLLRLGRVPGGLSALFFSLRSLRRLKIFQQSAFDGVSVRKTKGST